MSGVTYFITCFGETCTIKNSLIKSYFIYLPMLTSLFIKYVICLRLKSIPASQVSVQLHHSDLHLIHPQGPHRLYPLAPILHGPLVLSPNVEFLQSNIKPCGGGNHPWTIIAPGRWRRRKLKLCGSNISSCSRLPVHIDFDFRSRGICIAYVAVLLTSQRQG